MYNQSSLPQDFLGAHGHAATEYRERKPDHHYRTEIPNVIFELGLDPYCIRVYLQIKRITGDGGVCWKSYVNLAKDCGMGESKFKECIKELATPNKILPCPLIEIIPRIKADGSRDTNLIQVNDIWRDNGDFFRKPITVNDQSIEGVGSIGTEGVGSRRTEGVGCEKMEGVGRETSRKKNPLKKKKNTCLLPIGQDRLSDEKDGVPSNGHSTAKTVEPSKTSGKVETGQSTQTGNITIQGRKGPETITESQLYTAIINSKGDWAADEIRYAWKMLAEYKNTVYDWWAFIKGTMQKFRDQKLSDRISNKGLRKTCSQKQTSENSNANTSESVTEEQASPKLSSLTPARWNLTLGNKNHTTH